MRQSLFSTAFSFTPSSWLTTLFAWIWGPLLWFSQQGGIVSQRTAAALLAVLTLAVIAGPSDVGAQQAQNQNDEIIRRAKSKVQPSYPELARKMNISGTVKIEVIVAPNGSVKEARVV